MEWCGGVFYVTHLDSWPGVEQYTPLPFSPSYGRGEWPSIINIRQSADRLSSMHKMRPGSTLTVGIPYIASGFYFSFFGGT